MVSEGTQRRIRSRGRGDREGTEMSGERGNSDQDVIYERKIKERKKENVGWGVLRSVSW